MKEVSKIPYRFIYSSSPDRGLSYLLQIFPRIVEKYPEATLQIFCNSRFISAKDKEIIKNSDNIYLNGRVSQEQISIEYLKSDVWLYPTDFTETYCITAVEAQASGCLCVTMDVGSLGEIVDDRGVVVKGDIKDKKIQENILEKLFEVMDNKELKENYVTKAKEWALKQNYESLALEWSQNLFN